MKIILEIPDDTIQLDIETRKFSEKLNRKVITNITRYTDKQVQSMRTGEGRPQKTRVEIERQNDIFIA